MSTKLAYQLVVCTQYKANVRATMKVVLKTDFHTFI